MQPQHDSGGEEEELCLTWTAIKQIHRCSMGTERVKLGWHTLGASAQAHLACAAQVQVVRWTGPAVSRLQHCSVHYLH